LVITVLRLDGPHGAGPVGGDGRLAVARLSPTRAPSPVNFMSRVTADHRVRGLARVDQLLGDPLGLVDRYAKPSPIDPAWPPLPSVLPPRPT